MRLPTFILLLLLSTKLFSQEHQTTCERNAFLATAGNMSVTAQERHEHSQSLFFAIQESDSGAFYVRLFDPDCGGQFDRASDLWETNTIFELIGGKGCISNADSRSGFPQGDYKSGKSLDKKIFAKESRVDGKWIPMGPFDVSEGESLEAYPGYRFFKLVIEGHCGDDYNVFSVELSKSATENFKIENFISFQYRSVYLDEGSYGINSELTMSELTEELVIPVELPEIQNEKPAYRVVLEEIDEEVFEDE